MRQGQLDLKQLWPELQYAAVLGAVHGWFFLFCAEKMTMSWFAWRKLNERVELTLR